MVERETIPERETIFLKELNLITPNYAQTLGLSAEKPVLTSLSDSRYLIYEPGEVTRITEFFDPLDTGSAHTIEWLGKDIGAVRSHPRVGIGYDKMSMKVTTNGCLYFSELKSHGWVAVVEPMGKTMEWEDYLFAFNSITDELRVKELRVFCTGCMNGPLKEGLVLEIHKNGYLSPCCGLENHTDAISYPKFDFQIDPNGKLLISE